MYIVTPALLVLISDTSAHRYYWIDRLDAEMGRDGDIY